MNAVNENWFDNQAGVVDFIDDKKIVQRADYSIDQLKEKLLVVNQKIHCLADIYKQTGNDSFIEEISKLNRYRMYVQIQIAKMKRDGDDPLVGQLKDAKKKIHLLTTEVAQLNKRLHKSTGIQKNHAQVISNLHQGIKNQKQKTINIQNAYPRNLKVFDAFKEIIKSEFGHEVYIRLITVAGSSVDQSLGVSE